MANNSRAGSFIDRILARRQVLQTGEGSTQSDKCDINSQNVQQDRDFGCSDWRVARDSAPAFCPSLHYIRRTFAKNVPTRLLREQSLLRDFTEEYRAGFTAAR